jgi:hypothetical protein
LYIWIFQRNLQIATRPNTANPELGEVAALQIVPSKDEQDSSSPQRSDGGRRGIDKRRTVLMMNPVPP